jgi:uncharacterized repeat protein (TIGR03803 family)
MRHRACAAGLLLFAAAGALPSNSAAQPVQLLHTFTTSPAHPRGALLPFPDGRFYGVTNDGIFRLSGSGEVVQVARLESGFAVGGLAQASDGALYGVTTVGAVGGRSAVFRFDPLTRELRVVHAFPPEGTAVFGGLVAVGGSPYGVTSGVERRDSTIFHVVVATGAVVTDYRFDAAVEPAGPIGSLVLAPDGRLYGPSRGGLHGYGGLYWFDPVSRAVGVVHAFTGADGRHPRVLSLGVDGALYGSCEGGGPQDAGTLFRYWPATGVFEHLYSMAPSNGRDGREIGPVLAASDGHVYGLTHRRADGSGNAAGILFRLRTGAGAAGSFEVLRSLDRVGDGWPQDTQLTQGVDGRIYGYATSGGPTATGTLFRFDPAGSDPASLAFTVLYTFPYASTWRPSVPTAAADGLLYGTTSQGGPTNRGTVYRLDPRSGAVTILAAMPGVWATATTNSPLVPGPDGFLYGTTNVLSPTENSIVRVDPATGIPTIAVSSEPPRIGGWQGLIRTAAGVMYTARSDANAMAIYRFDPGTGTIALAAQTGMRVITPMVAAHDEQVWLVGNREFAAPWGTSLLRLNGATTSGVETIPLSRSFAHLGGLAQATDGELYLAAWDDAATAVLRIDRAAGEVSTACNLPGGGASASVSGLTATADGALRGIVESTVQQLFRCVPATGTVTLQTLPTGIGRAEAPLVAIAGALYGTSSSSSGGGSLFRIALAATLPAVDTDADTLPNEWEAAVGLDPFDAGGGSGAGDDPDRDGRTNAQEFAAGTHPRGVVRRLFAEGASNAFFQTRFDVTNVEGEAAALVHARFLTDTGETVATDVVVPPHGHAALDAASVPGLRPGSFSTIVESDVAIAVERTMTWGAGAYGSHLETGVDAPSPTWYFAEGSTSGEFSLFYLLQNPQPDAVTATIRYLRPSGQPPVERSYTLPPASRTTIVVDAGGPELASTDLAAVITAPAPIVAERAMYLNRSGVPFAGGHASAGVTAPALDWFLADGATGAFFDLFVLIANPSADLAVLDVQYLRSSGPPLTKRYAVAAGSRLTLWVDDEQLPAGSGQRPLAEGSVAIAVHAANGVPVVVERTMWWPGPETTDDYWYEAHNSHGTTGGATRWAIGGVEVGGPDDAESYVMLANIADREGTARLSVMGDDGSVQVETVILPPQSRTTVSVRAAFEGRLPAGRFGLTVDSIGADPVGIVVEHATYASPGGVFWARGSNALAAPLP